jgi:hypothetical protein
MSRTLLRLALPAALVATLGATALAGQVGECIKAASGNYKECKGNCKDDFQTAKDACINKCHPCVDACREVRAECVDATGFADAIKACNGTMAAAISDCKTKYPKGSVSRDNCIDDAQVAGFVCRLGVRKDKKPALTACRNGFRSCVQGCPSTCDPMCPAPCSQVDDSKQCRQQAAADYKTCGATCREEFQFAKDTCRNRDHDCVEGCRAARDTCDQPVQATLDQALAQCKADKQHAIDLCNGDPMCIEGAQVVAFQCRDDAHEAARPGFAACQQDFEACARACPPPGGSPSGAFLN